MIQRRATSTIFGSLIAANALLASADLALPGERYAVEHLRTVGVLEATLGNRLGDRGRGIRVIASAEVELADGVHLRSRRRRGECRGRPGQLRPLCICTPLGRIERALRPARLLALEHPCGDALFDHALALDGEAGDHETLGHVRVLPCLDERTHVLRQAVQREQLVVVLGIGDVSVEHALPGVRARVVLEQHVERLCGARLVVDFVARAQHELQHVLARALAALGHALGRRDGVLVVLLLVVGLSDQQLHVLVARGRLKVLVGVLDRLAEVVAAVIELCQRLGTLQLLAGGHQARGHLLLEQARGIQVSALLQVHVPQQFVDLVLLERRLRADRVRLLDGGEGLVPLLALNGFLRGLEVLADRRADLLVGRHGRYGRERNRRCHQHAGRRHRGAQYEGCLPHRSPHWGNVGSPLKRKAAGTHRPGSLVR